MTRRAIAVAATAVLAAALASPAAAADSCARRAVPPPPPAPAGPEAVAAYVGALDRASARIRSGTLGRSVQGRSLPYAIAGSARALRPGALRRTGARLRAIRRARAGPGPPQPTRPATSAVVWLLAGVHGNERSGVDADLRLLRELAAGRHCAALRRTLVVVVPVQNPDGLAAGTRTNAAGFDLNRDWFAATQPETRAKLALLDELPPMLLADQHEQDGSGFFFPPNADPVHHEIAAPPLRAIAAAGASLGRAFDRAGADHVSGGAFDLFFMGYADTASSTRFGAAGMTLEKGGAAPLGERVVEQLLAARTLVTTAARRRAALVRGWARTWRQARREGARGRLQPNAVTEPGHRVVFQVPRAPVHAYLLRADRHDADAAALVARLRDAGVRVGRLGRRVRMPRFRPYGSSHARPARLPAGTWVVELAQPHKHWIQALLGQDAYVPFPYFYDVSSWSNPLLMGLDGGWTERPLPRGALRRSGRQDRAAPAGAPALRFAGDSAAALGLAAELLRSGATVHRVPGSGEVVASGLAAAEVARRAAARRVALTGVAGPPAEAVAPRAPRVALLADLAPVVTGRAGHENSALHQSHGWMRFVLEQRLGVDVDVVSPAELAAGALRDRAATALVVADGQIPAGALDAAALAALQRFVAAGGTYVGVRSLGLEVARAAGITDAQRRRAPATLRVPGATFAVTVDDASPLGWGLGGRGFQHNASDPILAPGGGTAVVRYPRRRGFVSGYAAGIEPLLGTPALVDGRFGAGRVALFASDPSFRGYVERGQALLANALLAPPPAAPRARAPRVPVAPPASAIGARPRELEVPRD